MQSYLHLNIFFIPTVHQAAEVKELPLFSLDSEAILIRVIGCQGELVSQEGQ